MNASSLPSRTRAWNNALIASPGALDLDIPAVNIEGTIPKALFGGSLLSNGPGWNVIGGVNAHPFDGHGYVRRFHFAEDGSVKVRARFIETPSYLAEAKANRLMHRGFATNLDGAFWRNFGFGPGRNVANTTITRWNGRLLAGWENGAPYSLDPETLATHGEEHFDGAIKGLATLAHMKFDAAKDRLILCAVKRGRMTGLTFREVDRAGRVVHTHDAELGNFPFTHDYAMTSKWIVLGGNPLKFKPAELAKMLLGTSSLLRSLATNPEAPSVIHLISRDGGPMRTVTLPGPAWIIHYGNAFERDGDVIVDASAFSAFEFGEEFGFSGPKLPFDPTKMEVRGKQSLYRITIPRDATAAKWELLCDYGIDFPRFHPQHEGVETPALFGATRADQRYSDPFDSLIRVDLLNRDRVDVWTAKDDQFTGEPIFVPDPSRPDHGHVLSVVSDGSKLESLLHVFDAQKLSAGPIASVKLPLLPMAFHGDWDAAA